MRSHTLHSFFPGIFLGAVVGLIFGSLWMAQVADGELQRLRQSYESNGITVGGTESCALTSTTVDLVHSVDGKQVTVKVGSATVEEMTFEGAVFAWIWEQSDEHAYVAVRPDGIGGYILYPISVGLYRVDLCDGAVDVITAFLEEGALAISPDETRVAIREERGILIRDIATGKDIVTFTVPEEYGQFGDVFFSPDGSKIAFAASAGDPEGESGATFIGNIATGQIEQAGKVADGVAHVTGWVNNETIE